MAVLDLSGNILLGVEEALGRENKVIIAKIYWLSNKENGKTYRLMVIYIIKASNT
jgi:hypothetical protein